MSIIQAEERFGRIPYAGALGVEIEELGEEYAVLRLPHDAAHDNANGTLNGGATASLINIAGTMAAWTGIDLDASPSLRTVDMAVQYQSAAFEEDVLAHARVTRRGRNVFFLDVALKTPDGRPVCQGMMIYRSPAYGDHDPRNRASFAPRSMPVEAQTWKSRGMLKGFGEKLDMSSDLLSEGFGRIKMAGGTSNQDEQDYVHDGAVAALADFGGTVTAWSLFDSWKSIRGSTVGMQLTYAQPATGEVTCDAFLEHRGEEAFLSSVAVTEVKTGALVCLGQVSYRLLEPR